MNISSDKAVMFNYTAGIISDNDCDIKNSQLLTGASFTPFIEDKYDFVQIKAEDENIFKKILCDENNNIRVAMTLRKNGGKNIINTLPFLKAEILREIAENAGCHCYTNKSAVVYGDNRFIGIFSNNIGELKIMLKEKGTYKNIFSNEIFEDTDIITKNIKENEAVFLVMQ